MAGRGQWQLLFEMLVLTSAILSRLSVVDMAAGALEWEQGRWLHGKQE